MTAHAIDEEVRRVIESNYTRAKGILERNLEKLHMMAEALIKYETIDEDQLKDIMAGKTPKPPVGWDDTLSNKPPKTPRRRAPRRAGRRFRPASTKDSPGAPARLHLIGPAGAAHVGTHVPAALRRTHARACTPRWSWGCSTSRPTPSPTAAVSPIRRRRSRTGCAMSPPRAQRSSTWAESPRARARQG